MDPTSRTFTIAGIGEVLWDIYHDQRHVGGAPANLAIHATQLGDRAVLVSRVGDDGMGQELLRALQQRGLPTTEVQVDMRKGTGTVLIALDVKGVPSFRCSRDVAFDYLRFTPELAEVARRVDAVVFGTLAQRTPVAREAIMAFLKEARQAVKLFDVNSRAAESELLNILPASMAAADVVKMSREETELARRVLRREGDTLHNFAHFLIREFHLRLVAVTNGANGCELFTAHESCRIPGWQVEVVDTTGAGDGFTAGLIHKYLRGASLAEMGAFANLLGAFLCTQHGATPVFNLKQLAALERELRAAG